MVHILVHKMWHPQKMEYAKVFGVRSYDVTQKQFPDSIFYEDIAPYDLTPKPFPTFIFWWCYIN